MDFVDGLISMMVKFYLLMVRFVHVLYMQKLLIYYMSIHSFANVTPFQENHPMSSVITSAVVLQVWCMSAIVCCHLVSILFVREPLRMKLRFKWSFHSNLRHACPPLCAATHLLWTLKLNAARCRERPQCPPSRWWRWNHHPQWKMSIWTWRKWRWM